MSWQVAAMHCTRPSAHPGDGAQSTLPAHVFAAWTSRFTRATSVIRTAVFGQLPPQQPGSPTNTSAQSATDAHERS